MLPSWWEACPGLSGEAQNPSHGESKGWWFMVWTSLGIWALGLCLLIDLQWSAMILAFAACGSVGDPFPTETWTLQNMTKIPSCEVSLRAERQAGNLLVTQSFFCRSKWPCEPWIHKKQGSLPSNILQLWPAQMSVAEAVPRPANICWQLLTWCQVMSSWHVLTTLFSARLWSLKAWPGSGSVNSILSYR